MTKIAFAVPGDITTLTGGTIYDKRVIEKLRALGCEVTHIALPGSFPNPSASETASAIAQLASVPPDVPLVVDGLAFGALPPEDVRELKAPLVPLVHHPLALEGAMSVIRENALYETEKQNLAAARRVIVPSLHTAEVLVRDYAVSGDQITVARPGTDPVVAQSRPDNPALILSVGIQLPRKGHDVLLRALAQLKDLSWTAVIAGTPLDDDYAAGLRGLRLTEGLESRVTLAGRVSDAELASLYHRASIFGLATRYEGYGIVFDEAIAHGLPIVTCDVGAVSDTVPKRAGLLVPPDDPSAFADALRRALTDNAKRQDMAAAAKDAAKSLSTWQDTARAFLTAIERVT